MMKFFWNCFAQVNQKIFLNYINWTDSEINELGLNILDDENNSEFVKNFVDLPSFKEENNQKK
jgi:hypothetical protein